MRDLIQKLRAATGAGILDCKKALEEASGSLLEAIKILEKTAGIKAAKKQEREAREGLIGVYIHSNGKIASMIEVNCETDFVARNAEFKELAHNLAMQVAAMNPQCLTEDELLEDEKNKADELCLLRQSYIKDDQMTIEDLINQHTAKLGEKIAIGRFVRYEI